MRGQLKGPRHLSRLRSACFVRRRFLRARRTLPAASRSRGSPGRTGTAAHFESRRSDAVAASASPYLMGPGGVGVAREEIARQLCVRVEDDRGEAMRNRKKERDDKAHGGFL